MREAQHLFGRESKTSAVRDCIDDCWDVALECLVALADEW